jgi:hypothetical protein
MPQSDTGVLDTLENNAVGGDNILDYFQNALQLTSFVDSGSVVTFSPMTPQVVVQATSFTQIYLAMMMSSSRDGILISFMIIFIIQVPRPNI